MKEDNVIQDVISSSTGEAWRCQEKLHGSTRTWTRLQKIGSMLVHKKLFCPSLIVCIFVCFSVETATSLMQSFTVFKAMKKSSGSSHGNRPANKYGTMRSLWKSEEGGSGSLQEQIPKSTWESWRQHHTGVEASSQTWRWMRRSFSEAEGCRSRCRSSRCRSSRISHSSKEHRSEKPWRHNKRTVSSGNLKILQRWKQGVKKRKLLAGNYTTVATTVAITVTATTAIFKKQLVFRSVLGSQKN